MYYVHWPISSFYATITILLLEVRVDRAQVYAKQKVEFSLNFRSISFINFLIDVVLGRLLATNDPFIRNLEEILFAENIFYLQFCPGRFTSSKP